jgi:penicillin-binding protein 1C
MTRNRHQDQPATTFTGMAEKPLRAVGWVSLKLQQIKNTVSMRSKTWKKLSERKSSAVPEKPGQSKSVTGKDKKNQTPRSRFFRVVTFPILHPVGRVVFLLLLLLFIAGTLYVLRDLPSPTNLTSGNNFAVSTQIFDRNGKPLYEVFGSENRTPIKLKVLPPHVYQAVIAIEDKNFYHHFGFDILGMIRAVRNTLTGTRIEGGSTITQQLVKNALLTRDKTLQRKIKEVILAMATEVIYSKDDILEMYLNYISYGGTSIGIESASKKYFDKSAKDLDLAEAAMLAGLPQSPTTYSPYGSNPIAAKNRQKEVLRRMVDDKYITQAQADQAEQEVLHFALNKTDIQAPHFVFYVRDLLYEKYGEEKVEKGGLRVYTSLDLDLQNVAQASLSAQVEKLKTARVSNGAALVLKPNTGEILAMIGSKDYFDTKDDGQVNVTISERQPGSSIKPIMYATAMQNKLLNPGTNLLDVPTCFDVPGQKQYCPKNYDGGFHGPVSIRTSLGNSLNIPAVKSLKIIGVTNFIQQAQAMGITSWTDPANYGLSLTLGGGEVKMMDLAQAFSVLADEGVKVPLIPILKVEDYRGNILEEVRIDERLQALQTLTDDEDLREEGDLQRVMNRAPAYLTSHILQDNNARTMAFGPRSKLVIPNQIVSVKTGTTNDIKDNWTVGFTPEFLVAVWVGNNDGTQMNHALVSGVTGAAPIFNDIMSFILKDKKPLWQEKPDDVASALVCVSGFPPPSGQDCPNKQQELYWQRSQPSNSGYVTKEVWIHPETGLPLQPGEPTDGLQLQQKTVLSDPLTGEYCFDCARPVDPEGKTMYEQHIVPYIVATGSGQLQNQTYEIQTSQ